MSEFIQTLLTTLDEPANNLHVNAERESWASLSGRFAQKLMSLLKSMRQRLSISFKRVQSQRHISVIERTSLAPRSSLVLIEVDGERFLLSLVQGAQASFHSLRTSESPAGISVQQTHVARNPSTGSHSFQAMLKQMPKGIRRTRRLV